MTLAPAPWGPGDRSGRTPSRPALLAVAQGPKELTDDPAVDTLLQAVSRAAPGLHVVGSVVDVHQPELGATIAEQLAPGEPVVVVPLMLSAGFHVHGDLAHELAAQRTRRTAISRALGPDAVIVELLAAKLTELGLAADDVIVLAAAGSSDHRAVRDCIAVGRHLAGLLERNVTVGFLSAAVPRLASAVDTMRRLHPGSRVIVASYLLSPGRFAEVTASVGGDVVSGPLLAAGRRPPQALVDLVLARYEAGAAQLA
ncbi:sirohydrochlorin chelatase [Gryllotalpicola ginsengisoli]|uniref:sirohydrochlorin chelatase n=1 Tax=Gryllotalpicola ginsengisoli TaxID=444608 RepID=UPI0003B31A18|nr:CbiX/SirB N-terminal domain-containing protein [Gryllotalpicola ginsengisoli]